jgi:tetrahydromethanopterin S-methyltransferase subunit B
MAKTEEERTLEIIDRYLQARGLDPSTIERRFNELNELIHKMDEKMTGLDKRLTNLEMRIAVLDERTGIMKNLQYALVGGTYGSLIAIVLLIIGLVLR